MKNMTDATKNVEDAKILTSWYFFFSPREAKLFRILLNVSHNHKVL